MIGKQYCSCCNPRVKTLSKGEGFCYLCGKYWDKNEGSRDPDYSQRVKSERKDKGPRHTKPKRRK